MNAFADFDAQFEHTLEIVNGSSGTGTSVDPNQFRPMVGVKKLEYQATLRFIPPMEGPLFVKKIVHFMRVGGRTVRVICPKTAANTNRCDICLDNIQGHRSKNPAMIERARSFGNKIRWVANVLVLEDSNKPENEGKVLWWEFPNQIMEYIEKLRTPPNPRIPAVNAFHPIKGADFFLCMKQVDSFTRYEGSQFLTPSPISSNFNVDVLRNSCHGLQEHTIITPHDEIVDILAKADSGFDNSVQKSYSNVFDQHNRNTHQPSSSGFASVRRVSENRPNDPRYSEEQSYGKDHQTQRVESNKQYGNAQHNAPKPVDDDDWYK